MGTASDNTGHLLVTRTNNTLTAVVLTSHNAKANKQLGPLADSCGSGNQVTMADNWSGHYSRRLSSGQYRTLGR